MKLPSPSGTRILPRKTYCLEFCSSNVSKNGIGLEGSVVDVLAIDDAGKSCRSATDLEFSHRDSDCNNDTTTVAANDSGKSVDCESVALDLPVNWICRNCIMVSAHVSCFGSVFPIPSLEYKSPTHYISEAQGTLHTCMIANHEFIWTGCRCWLSILLKRA
jgi:hypothetical protein